MKVILVENERLDFPPLGGISTLIRQILIYSGQTNFQIYFAGAGEINSSAFPKVNFIRISKKEGSNFLFFLKFIRKASKIPTDAETAFHFFHAYFILIFYFFKISHPLILSITGRQDLSFRKKWGCFAAFIYRKVILPLAFKRVNQLIFVDEKTRKYYHDHFKIKVKSCVIASSVDVNKFDFKPSISGRKKFGFAETSKLILFAGRICPEKNLDFLLHIYQILKLQMPDSYLIMAGNGPDLLLIKTKVIQLGIENVIFFEHIRNTELVDLMNISDILVLTSFYEASPTVIKEALSCCLPIVTTRVGDVEEVLNGLINCIIAESKTKEFVDAIEKAIQIGKQPENRERAMKYRVEKIIPQYFEQYRLIMEG